MLTAILYSQPSMFECNIRPRNAKAEALIRTVHDVPYGH